MVLKPIRDDLRATYVALVAWLLAAHARGQAILEASDHPLGAKVAQSDTVIAGVVVVIIGSVGVVIVSSVTNAFDAPSNTGLSESQQNLLEGFGAMLDLVEPLLVVLMAVVLIAVIQRVQA